MREDKVAKRQQQGLSIPNPYSVNPAKPENRSATLPLSQYRGTPQQFFKIDLRHILGD